MGEKPYRFEDCDGQCSPDDYRRVYTTAPIIFRPTGYSIRPYSEDPEWRASPDGAAYYDFSDREDRPSWAANRNRES